jgi:phosphate-selective porin OprO/OprP
MAVGRAEAADSAPTAISWAESLDHLGRLHLDEEHPWLQELWVLGRYHGQYHWADGSQGEDEGWEDRRFRVGGQARLFERLTLHAQMVSGSDFDPFYNGFSELWVQWEFNEAMALTVGQQKHRFTHERTTSSRYINTVERSLLVNMINAEYTPAVTLSGKSGRIRYYGGWFSNTTGRDMGSALTEFDGGGSFLASVTYDMGSVWGADTAHLIGGLVFSDANENADYLDYFSEGFSTALVLTRGPVSLMTEVLAGLGNDHGDTLGISLQPGWFLTRKLQLVGRYQLAMSDEDTGIRAQRRYERPAGLTTGDLYQAGYLGANYYLAGHRLKLLTGVEYATLGGEDVWTVFTGIRVYWGPHARGPFPMAQVLQPR